MKSNDSILIKNVKVSAYKIPTDLPEADGTIQWNSTTIVLTEIEGGGKKGLGYTYAHEAAAIVIDKTLKQIVVGKNVMDIESITSDTISAIRNNGDCGIAMMAVSAVDNALWDLKAKLLNLPLCALLGKAKDGMPVYGSGGFTTYSNAQTKKQFQDWAAESIVCFKMKIGSEPEKDIQRIAAGRKAIGGDAAIVCGCKRRLHRKTGTGESKCLQ